MNREDLISIGLTEEQANKVMSFLDGDFVTKARFEEVNETNKNLKQSIAERDEQLEKLKKTDGDVAELKGQIENLQKLNAEQTKAHEAQMKQLKLDNAIDTELRAVGAKNIKAVRPFIDAGKIKLDDDGKLTGLNEQLAEIQKTDGYLFASKEQTFKGFEPGASGDVKPGAEIDASKMSYSEMVAYMAENPDVQI